MTHHKKVRAAVEQCKDDDDAIIHFGESNIKDGLQMKVVFEDEITLTAEQLIMEDDFLISPSCLENNRLELY